MHLEASEIRKHGVRLKLQQQPFQVLESLLERPGEIVTRDELRKRLWPDGVFVDYDRGLNKAVNRLREVLGDNADQPRFVETVPQRGYRFVGTVDREEPAPEIAGNPAPDRRRFIAGLAALAAVPAGAGLYYSLRSAASRQIRSIAVLPLENLSNDPAQEFFSDGMTDELIGELAHISSLRVISRTSVMGYKKVAVKSCRRSRAISTSTRLSKVP